MYNMKIEASKFENFPYNGAINIEIDNVDVDITDSIFTLCNSNMSGGAIRVSNMEGNCNFERDCGTSCYTITPGGAHDFGQFIYVGCSSGNTELKNIAATRCPDREVTYMQNGPIGFIGNAKFRCSNSNVSNSYCQLGPGFAAFETSDVILCYMNFANGTAHTTSKLNDWLAADFYQASGTVTMSNFYECKSKASSPSKPAGTYTKCFFIRCENYNLGLLSSDNTVNSHSEIFFPKKCAARIVIEDNCHFNFTKTILTLTMSLVFEGVNIS